MGIIGVFIMIYLRDRVVRKPYKRAVGVVSSEAWRDVWVMELEVEEGVQDADFGLEINEELREVFG
jgi:hypothetical protein